MRGILEQVVEAPQRSAPVLDSSGQLAIYNESTYSLSTHETKSASLVLDVKSGSTVELPSDGQHLIWVEPSRNVLWQKTVDSKTELWISNVTNPSAKYQLASFTRNATLFQAVELLNGDIGVLLHASWIDGQNEEWPRSSGRVFSSYPCLTFDQGVGRARYNLLFLRVSKDVTQAERSYRLGNAEPVDVLASSNLDFFPYSGSMPNISTPNCALSSSGIALVAQDENTDTQRRFTSEAYFVPLPEPEEAIFARPIHLPTGSYTGWAALPVFTQDGQQLAFLKDESENSICIDRHIFIVRDIQKSLNAEPIRLTADSGDDSNLYPEWVQWGPDGKVLYFQACDTGRARLFRIDAATHTCKPTRIAPIQERTGSVMAASIKGDMTGAGRCLQVETSLTSPNRFFNVDLATKAFHEVPSQDIPDFGLKAEQVNEVWIENDGYHIHTFIMRPSFFEADKKYPVALLVHGGPVASWLDAFHLYWTLPLFAEAGYVLIIPNFIGSTGYSRDFRAAGWGHLAEKPYRDLEACMNYVGKELCYVDMSRAVALGGSYGAYMMYWIAGQPLGKRFRALIAHAGGCFGNTSFCSSDLAPYFPRLLTRADEDFDPKDVNRTMFRSDAAQHAQNWTTPMLFTHGEKDNRCPLSNSLAAFAHCQNLGVESRLVTFPDESHFILKPENNYHWYSEFIRFMDEHTKF